MPIDSYLKYGPTPGHPEPSFYEFLWDGTPGTTGAELIDANGVPGVERIVLHFVDGQLGDYDLTANGEILDPGGPVLVAAPSVESVVINDGHAQRSKVNSLTVTFDSAVTLDAGAFELVHESGVRIALAVAGSEVNGRTVAVLRFTGPGIIGGSLFNGDYTLVVHADKVRSALGDSLDGDNDGAAGGNYHAEFFRRFGDSDGDRDVDAIDAQRFATTFLRRAGDPRYLSYFDWDDDGRVALIDSLAFAVSALIPPR